MRLPYNTARKISVRAVEIAKQIAPRKTGKGAEGLQPSYSDGTVGITTTPETAYMLVQNYGMEPRVMEELAGRTIPIRGANGSINFRTASPRTIGTIKVVARDEDGEIVSKIAWRHPGIKGSHFIEQAIEQATQEWIRSAPPEEVLRVLLDSKARGIVEGLTEL